MGIRISRHHIILLAAVATFVIALMNASTATATTERFVVYPGLSGSGLHDYGWHFDEVSKAYAARDYNHTSDNGVTAYFNPKLTSTPPYPIRWKLTHYGSCGTAALAQQYISGTWYDKIWTDIHYVHLDSRPTDGSYTSSLSTNGASLSEDIGETADCDLTGSPTPYHLHQSGLVVGGYVDWASYSGDTCWVDDDHDVADTHCPGSSWEADDGTSSCPPGAASGTADSSGEIYRYICQTWGYETRSASLEAFSVSW